MNTIRAYRAGAPPASHARIRTLVVSQHDGVRRQLALCLSRSPRLDVSGDVFSTGTIISARPDVLVLDLGQLDRPDILRAIDAARHVGAHLIGLASMHDPGVEHAITAAGGLYHLKVIGEDELVATILDLAAEPTSSTTPRDAPEVRVGVRAADRRSRRSPGRTANPRRRAGRGGA
jgi:DNA-binding NarL/FixJ family response regulator